MQQAQDFLDESEALHTLIAPLSDAEFEQPTLFKGRSINQIMRHLHFWNIPAAYTLTNDAAFAEFLKQVTSALMSGRLVDFEHDYLQALSGRALLAEWATQFRLIAPYYAAADPSSRVNWVGPSMSARSAITARQMETWAHGQAIYDVLGVERVDADRIGNIARLGINTFGWTFKNRSIAVPETMPFVRLTAPSGAVWDYGEACEAERVEGSATEFCQVVTQCRNIGDTALKVSGPVATRWMSMAQCFAGPPNDPPGVGVRRKT